MPHQNILSGINKDYFELDFAETVDVADALKTE
jgi:hypothetical protein